MYSELQCVDITRTTYALSKGNRPATWQSGAPDGAAPARVADGEALHPQLLQDLHPTVVGLRTLPGWGTSY